MDEHKVRARSFGELYLLYRRIPAGRFNSRALSFLALISMIIACISLLAPDLIVLDALADAVEIGLNTSIALAGVWIAGFAIFAGYTRMEFFLFLRSEIEPRTRVTFLKYTFALFLGAIADLLLLAAVSFVLDLLVTDGNLLFVTMNALDLPDARSVMSKILLAAYVVGFFYILLMIKSFAFNLYNVLMLGIEFYAKEQPKD